jgi:hypothetical protein
MKYNTTECEDNITQCIINCSITWEQGNRGRESNGALIRLKNDKYLKYLCEPTMNNQYILKMWEIPRWRLEGGGRKRASYSEILERRWRHTLQA